MVLLDTTFLDARVRLGRNREGTRFVCVRTADSAAEGWRLPLARASTAARDALRLALSMAIVLLIAKRTAVAAVLRLPRLAWAHAPGGVVNASIPAQTFVAPPVPLDGLRFALLGFDVSHPHVRRLLSLAEARGAVR